MVDDVNDRHHRNSWHSLPLLMSYRAVDNVTAMAPRFGDVELQRVRVETVTAERSGAVGACIAPVYTLRSSLRPWLRSALSWETGLLQAMTCVGCSY